ncbi:hypothetical protein [Enhygromyxa salina]|uniref:hypothetical protein n=1 Tax=Enhygromyxa salina TaxID=215803 RepID=UPI0011BAD3C7|nr:hypothetical protein [Enhygromyxa salina]
MLLLSGAACDSPDSDPDPLAEGVRVDTASCRSAMGELAACGPTADCRPDDDPESAPLSLRVLIDCAAAACAGVAADEIDQCRFDAMLFPGPTCDVARKLCEEGDDPAAWLAEPL